MTTATTLSAPSRRSTGTPAWVWIVSLLMHGGLLYLVATSAGDWFGRPGLDAGDGGTPGDEFHSVGVVIRSPADARESTSDAPSDAVDAPSDATSTALGAAFDSGVPSEPPVPLDLPDANPPGIGPGSLQPVRPPLPGEATVPVRDGGVRQPAAISGLDPGETRFFGIRDKGTRILYVIDRSPSMFGKKLAAARQQLLISLETLLPEQQFQVLLFTKVAQPMELRGTRPSNFYRATSVNRTKTRGYLNSVVASESGGTDRKHAFERALALEPDVIYFLTDDDAVSLDKPRRDALTKLNGGRTRINCVQFGSNVAPSLDSPPLKELAKDNRGAYRYVRVGALP